ncbi:MAG: OmpA family protein [Bacteroidota bacterium]
MTHRLFVSLSLALALAASPARAQVLGTTYDTEPDGSGVRLGIGVGASVYNGPNILYPLSGIDQESVTETRPAVTAFAQFPLGNRFSGRALAGLLNLGADDDNEIARRGGNPFLTNEQLLLEGDLLLHFTPRSSAVAPYAFTGLGALIADPFGTDDVADALDRDRVAYVLPLGIGVDVRLSRNLGLFGEASYRFPLNSVGSSRGLTSSVTGPGDDPVCEADPTTEECIKKCEDDPTLPFCDDDNGRSAFDTRFGSALFTGGLRLGFGGGRRTAYIPPPPRREILVQRDTVFVEREIIPPVAPRVCEIVELNPVYFEPGSSALSTRARRLLDENIAILLENPACCVFIDGYTDSTEQERHGSELSRQRAQAVYDYYLSQGVAASRLQTRNRGAGMPSCAKEDPGIGCSRNRRVDSVPMDCERFQRILEAPNR